MSKLSTILDQIDSGTVLLPEFQRGYVWNRDQVRGLMRSLYRGHPVGSLLLWETTADDVSVRGSLAGSGTHLLLLDGQQRITSLYGVIRGKAPNFFEGNDTAFTGLYFDVATETFEFYAPSKMAHDHRWIDVTKLFVENINGFVAHFVEQDPQNLATYLARLTRLRGLLDREFHEEKITGTDKGVDEVVDIFNRVNSGGTKLSKGDLALAKLCADWPEARTAMRGHLGKWKAAGYDFSLDWLLRNATSVAVGRSKFEALERVAAADFQDALANSAHYIGRFLDAVSGRLGLDHDRVLMGRYAFPVVCRFLGLNGGKFSNGAERDKMLYWYIQSALWGRFAGSTETLLQQDYDVVKESGIDGLIDSLRRWRGGNLDVQAHDFEGSTRGSRFYPLLYLLTRVNGARDLATGLELRAEMLGKLATLQVHHIFPKALLYQAGYGRNEVNSVANFCFLTQDTNLLIGMRQPVDYFPEMEAKNPGVLPSQWIPTDPELWKVENYHEFLRARRDLLAGAAQSFLTKLATGVSAAAPASLQPLAVASDSSDDARTAQVDDLIDTLVRMGCGRPSVDTEIPDPVSGRAIAVAEAFWPDGLQAGQGSPVLLELDPDTADLPRLEELGYEVFTSADALLGFASRRNETAAGGPEQEPEPQSKVMPVPSASRALEQDFARAMRDIYDRAKHEANYPASYFLSTLADLGALTTARKLINSPAISDGFAALWERGRLDLTVEALVLRPCFASLFDEREREAAGKRLEQFGYRPA